MNTPSFEDIKAAHGRIAPFIHRTPVLTSELVDRIAGCTVFFKCENFQKVGAFKYRGATNAVLLLTEREAEKGVATHSSGNHAAALALAARHRGIPAYIVMPSNSPEVKINAVKGYGGIITFCEPTLEARETTLEKVVAETGATFIHPYDNPRIIAGQGTACKELLEKVPDLDIVVAPVGGGGLLSGTLIAARHIKPSLKLYAAEPLGANDAWQSFKAGQLIPQTNPRTIADGLRTSLSELTFSIIQKNCNDILCVSEESIIHSMRIVWERMKIIIEPSAAVPFAAVLDNPDLFAGKKTGIIISGGNAELDALKEVL
jgi:threonine dehydratase